MYLKLRGLGASSTITINTFFGHIHSTNCGIYQTLTSGIWVDWTNAFSYKIPPWDSILATVEER